ncbi:TetR/AcrR family transcriptional regulator [Nocardia sp. BMG111209]|uniref:TetR/AcrR family transcriptional regulator n=1 Tax=Nocardia sp. BMG111209 TaxID=1160137 RepID=UPI0003769FF7|nr:TetR/AcrR family transcriptional regulator [Nocardia sp. BMG111209]
MAVRSTPGGVVAGRSTKEAIREAAIELFSDKGFEQTSLREVADAVGITKASLYYHYASKQDLLLAIVDPIVDDLHAVADGLTELEHGPAGQRAILTRQVRAMLRHRRTVLMFVRDTTAIARAIANRDEELKDARMRLCRWLAGPDPSDEALLRAAAAFQVLTVALGSQELVPEADTELIERVVLDAALGVLGVGAADGTEDDRAHHG